MNRDNTEVPVGEFVDCLHAYRQAGQIHAFGGSNWSTARLQAANEYAISRGIERFSASSPNFSLAHWNEPMWGDGMTAVGTQDREWYMKSQLPLLAWSSQESGFFAGRFRPEDADNADVQDVARVWFSPENWERLRRAEVLAARYNVTALQIALA